MSRARAGGWHDKNSNWRETELYFVQELDDELDMQRNASWGGSMKNKNWN